MQVPVIIDIEASGLGRGSYPIEVGVALEDGQTYCTLIKPESDWQHWDPAAEICHGLTREQLFRFGRSIADVSRILNELLMGKIVYTDAWSNDSCWLDLLFEYAETPRMFRLETLRALLSEQQLTHWHATKDDVIRTSKLTRHRASSDALILQMTFKQSHFKTNN